MTQDSLQHDLETLENSLNREAFISELASQVTPGNPLPRSGHDRRGQQRTQSARLIRLTPLAEDMATPSGPSIFVVEKSLARLGLGCFSTTGQAATSIKQSKAIGQQHQPVHIA